MGKEGEGREREKEMEREGIDMGVAAVAPSSAPRSARTISCL